MEHLVGMRNFVINIVAAEAPATPSDLMLWVNIAVTALALLGLVATLVRSRDGHRIRRWMENTRLLVGAGSIVAMAVVARLTSSAGVLAIAGICGLAVGWLQGRSTKVEWRDGRLFGQRAAWGVVVWALGLVAMQVAGIGGRVGIFQLGQTVSAFSLAALVGVIVGRTVPPGGDAAASSDRRSTIGAAVVVVCAGSLIAAAVMPQRADASFLCDAAIPGFEFGADSPDSDGVTGCVFLRDDAVDPWRLEIRDLGSDQIATERIDNRVATLEAVSNSVAVSDIPPIDGILVEGVWVEVFDEIDGQPTYASIFMLSGDGHYVDFFPVQSTQPDNWSPVEAMLEVDALLNGRTSVQTDPQPEPVAEEAPDRQTTREEPSDDDSASPPTSSSNPTSDDDLTREEATTTTTIGAGAAVVMVVTTVVEAAGGSGQRPRRRRTDRSATPPRTTGTFDRFPNAEPTQTADPQPDPEPPVRSGSFERIRTSAERVAADVRSTGAAGSVDTSSAAVHAGHDVVPTSNTVGTSNQSWSNWLRNGIEHITGLNLPKELPPGPNTIETPAPDTFPTTQEQRREFLERRIDALRRNARTADELSAQRSRSGVSDFFADFTGADGLPTVEELNRMKQREGSHQFSAGELIGELQQVLDNDEEITDTHLENISDESRHVVRSMSRSATHLDQVQRTGSNGLQIAGEATSEVAIETGKNVATSGLSRGMSVGGQIAVETGVGGIVGGAREAHSGDVKKIVKGIASGSAGNVSGGNTGRQAMDRFGAPQNLRERLMRNGAQGFAEGVANEQVKRLADGKNPLDGSVIVEGIKSGVVSSIGGEIADGMRNVQGPGNRVYEINIGEK